MEEKLLNLPKGTEKPIFFIKKAMEAYCDGIDQNAPYPEVRKKLLSNRALINLWLKNYGKVVEDCLNSISLDKTFISPYVRCTEALVHLQKWEKAIQLAEKGINQEKENFENLIENHSKNFDMKVGKCKVFQDLKTEAQLGLTRQMTKENEKAKALELKNSQIAVTCAQKGIVLGHMSSFALPDIYSRELRVQEGLLVTPILFIYPEFG